VHAPALISVQAGARTSAALLTEEVLLEGAGGSFIETSASAINRSERGPRYRRCRLGRSRLTVDQFSRSVDPLQQSAGACGVITATSIVCRHLLMSRTVLSLLLDRLPRLAEPFSHTREREHVASM